MKKKTPERMDGKETDGHMILPEKKASKKMTDSKWKEEGEVKTKRSTKRRHLTFLLDNKRIHV